MAPIAPAGVIASGGTTMLPENERDLLLSNLPGMAYRCPVTLPWILEYVSDGVRALTGLEPEELTSGRTSWASIMHPDDLEQVAADVEKAVAQGREFTCTYRIFVAEGRQRWVMERGRAVYNASGEAIALVGFTTDLTDQKTIEAELSGKVRRITKRLSSSTRKFHGRPILPGTSLR